MRLTQAICAVNRKYAPTEYECKFYFSHIDKDTIMKLRRLNGKKKEEITFKETSKEV